jgi:hypothetical protein
MFCPLVFLSLPNFLLLFPSTVFRQPRWPTLALIGPPAACPSALPPASGPFPARCYLPYPPFRAALRQRSPHSSLFGSAACICLCLSLLLLCLFWCCWQPSYSSLESNPNRHVSTEVSLAPKEHNLALDFVAHREIGCRRGDLWRKSGKFCPRFSLVRFSVSVSAEFCLCTFCCCCIFWDSATRGKAARRHESNNKRGFGRVKVPRGQNKRSSARRRNSSSGSR